MIALDANGADGGPAVVAEGARLSGLPVLLFGPAAEMGPAGERIEVVDAPVRIAGGDEPVMVVRSRPEASIVQAAMAVGEGRADALVSAGSTGPTLAAATLKVKRLRGVHRPALAVLLPVPHGPVLLLDCGANVEVRPEHLEQFAYMGASFMQAVHGLERPRVGLLSVGDESGKGTPDVLAAGERLAEGGLDFVGNVEGFDLPAAGADVVVTDGFTGNVALKVLEGTAKTMTGAIREAIRSGPVSSLGGLLIRGRVSRLRARLDPEGVGGAIMLGLRRPVVVAHGSFGPQGIASAVRLARRAVDERMVERTAEALEAAGALRSVPAASFGRR
ncbi:MAG TPA: phosphate acyltransferase PlsX [Thermoleophilaceae bacterium]|nr:phosphate acyltransferase PlsX [Thermoleophilaceae bacterium]